MVDTVTFVREARAVPENAARVVEAFGKRVLAARGISAIAAAEIRLWKKAAEALRLSEDEQKTAYDAAMNFAGWAPTPPGACARDTLYACGG